MKYALRSARSRTSGCTANAYAPSVLSAASEVLSSAPAGTYAPGRPLRMLSGLSTAIAAYTEPDSEAAHAVRSRGASMAARALKWHEVAELRATASRLV